MPSTHSRWFSSKPSTPIEDRPGPSRRPSRSEATWNHLEEVAIFITKVYVKYWFEVPSAVFAPKNDLDFLQALEAFPIKAIGKAASSAFNRHLWYVLEVLVAFAFFDDRVTVAEKKKMVTNLQRVTPNDPPKRLPPLSASLKDLSDFVTSATMTFFKCLQLSADFLGKDPGEWAGDEEYRHSRCLVGSLKVVNDLAERGVALMSEFNASLTRNEEQ